MDTPEPSQTMNAEVYLAQLANRGVEYVFANAGTDFAPLIEARAHASERLERFLAEWEDASAQ